MIKIALALGNITLFNEGTSFVIDDFTTTSSKFTSVGASFIFADIDAANINEDEGFTMLGARFNTGSDVLPNLPVESTRRFVKDSRNVTNTFGGGTWELTTESLTTIATVSTPVKLAGTTSYDSLVYFSQTTNNAFVFDSTITKEFIISGTIVIDGGANDDINLLIRKYDSSAASYSTVRTFKRRISNVIGGLDVAIFNIECFAELSEDDRIEVWVENESDTTNVTGMVGSYLNINVRL